MCAFVRHIRDMFIARVSHLNNHIRDYTLSVSMPNLHNTYKFPRSLNPAYSTHTTPHTRSRILSQEHPPFFLSRRRRADADSPFRHTPLASRRRRRPSRSPVVVVVAENSYLIFYSTRSFAPRQFWIVVKGRARVDSFAQKKRILFLWIKRRGLCDET